MSTKEKRARALSRVASSKNRNGKLLNIGLVGVVTSIGFTRDLKKKKSLNLKMTTLQ